MSFYGMEMKSVCAAGASNYIHGRCCFPVDKTKTLPRLARVLKPVRSTQEVATT